ncbi:MAG: glycosyltransferase family 2 protein [Clostridia bacterium]|nr:glycosyltransferase family 2 protein [Clostridia bacterium]
MLLSIIIPVYNLEAYIGRCLDSCLAQTVQGGCEIICVNDGSMDNSLSVLREYESKYPNIRVIDKPNGGVSSARNAGIREARGDYIWFIDGDDWIADGSCEMIESILNGAEVSPDCVLFSYKIMSSYSNKSVVGEKYDVEILGQYGDFKNNYSSSSCCRWIKKDIILHNSMFFDEKMKYSEDTLFLARFYTLCKTTVAFNAPIYYYFQRSQSAMNNVNAVAHCYCMLKLCSEYEKMNVSAKDELVKKKTKNAYIRSMQNCCRDLCIYCNDFSFVKVFMKILKKNRRYPFGIDSKQFKRDKKQSFKNDLMNWFFGLLSFEPYFWICWFLCGIAFKSKRTQKFSLEAFNDVLNINGECNE